MRCTECNCEFYLGTTCPSCGHVNKSEPVSKKTMKCAKCNYEFSWGKTCPSCGYSNNTVENNSAAESDGIALAYIRSKKKNERPMKWYKFLKVSLWLSIVANIISAFLTFRGSAYQGLDDELYEMLPALKKLDMFQAIFCIAMAIFAFFIWHTLNNYRAIGPKLLILGQIANIAFLIIYMFAFNSIVENSDTKILSLGNFTVIGGAIYQQFLDLSLASSALMAITFIQTLPLSIMVVVNIIYFNKRADLFVK